ncbi:hypothetical protein HY992_00105 [Candidatus Micrarchaeota archaeon]|nr:hypothetical protein [Candidatus Micrarchaeota archaeon]
MKHMNKNEQEIYFRLEKEGLKIFNVEDLINLDFRKRVVHDALTSLVKKQIISRVRRNVYVRASPSLLYDALQQVESPLLIAAKAAGRQYYLGYASAMQAYGVSEQIPFTVYVASKQQKRNFDYGRYRVRFAQLSEKKFFGARKALVAGQQIWVSNEEKTVVDCVDRAEYCGGASHAFLLIKELARQKKLDWKKLLNCALKMGGQALLHRLGFVLEKVNSSSKKELIPKKLIAALAKKVKPSVYYLEKGVKGKFDKKWQLIAGEVEKHGA